MITATRYQLEAEYRKYFTEIRKFDPFPATVSYENVIDFLQWHDAQPSPEEQLRQSMRRAACNGEEPQSMNLRNVAMASWAGD